KIGMSYNDVQALLPKQAQQDPLAYVPSEEAFLLSVDIAGQTTWSASFKFDTIDLPARRPEQLIEISCSAGLSTRSESFETIVRKGPARWGAWVELDRSEENSQQGGGRVPGGSVLPRDYPKNTGSENNKNIDFKKKKNRRNNTPDSK